MRDAPRSADATHYAGLPRQRYGAGTPRVPCAPPTPPPRSLGDSPSARCWSRGSPRVTDQARRHGRPLSRGQGDELILADQTVLRELRDDGTATKDDRVLAGLPLQGLDLARGRVRAGGGLPPPDVLQGAGVDRLVNRRLLLLLALSLPRRWTRSHSFDPEPSLGSRSCSRPCSPPRWSFSFWPDRPPRRGRRSRVPLSLRAATSKQWSTSMSMGRPRPCSSSSMAQWWTRRR